MRASTCVVFDIDDTLYLEREYVRSGFHAVAAWARDELGFSDLAERAWRLFIAGARATIFDQVLSSYGVEPDRGTIERMVTVYREHQPTIGLLDDARDCLAQLKNRCPVAAVSDGPIASQRAKSRALELDRWMSPILLTAELGREYWKPSPAAFRLIEEAVGRTGPECIYVADNPAKDFAGPHLLGWRTVRIRRPDGLHAAALGGADVDVELSDLESFADLIGRSDLEQSGMQAGDR